MGLYDRLGLKPSGAAPHPIFDTKALSSYFTNLSTYYIDSFFQYVCPITSINTVLSPKWEN